MSIFREDDIGPWEAHHGLDSAGYQAVFNQRVGQQGMVPIVVQASTPDGTNRFAAIFARAEPAGDADDARRGSGGACFRRASTPRSPTICARRARVPRLSP